MTLAPGARLGPYVHPWSAMVAYVLVSLMWFAQDRSIEKTLTS
jgi:hypothetical protein